MARAGNQSGTARIFSSLLRDEIFVYVDEFSYETEVEIDFLTCAYHPADSWMVCIRIHRCRPRFAFSSFSAPSLDDFLDWNGILGRVPLLILLVSVYWFVCSSQIALYTGAFLIMSIFIGFNSVLFVQYMVWLVPLTLLLILDLKEKRFHFAVGD